MVRRCIAPALDTDLLRVSEVRIDIRLEATASSLRRLVPDEEIVLHVALRNRTHD